MTAITAFFASIIGTVATTLGVSTGIATGILILSVVVIGFGMYKGIKWMCGKFRS